MIPNRKTHDTMVFWSSLVTSKLDDGRNSSLNIERKSRLCSKKLLFFQNLPTLFKADDKVNSGNTQNRSIS